MAGTAERRHASGRRGRRRLVTGMCFLGSALGWLPVPALAQPEPALTVPVPTLEPAPSSGLRRQPVTSDATFGALARHGYRETEYFFSGEARWSRSPIPLVSPPELDPVLDALPLENARFRTRLLVREPVDPARASGTVFVEWFNVSAFADGDPLWVWGRDELTANGATYVGVTVQPAGVTSLKALDPVRYSALSHPGDAYDYDIFSQALALVRAGRLTPQATVRQVLAMGESQSALMLHDYIDSGAHGAAGAADGFLLDAGGATAFPRHEPDVPVLHFLSEESTTVLPSTVTRARPTDGRSSSPMYRSWWVAGAGHMDAWVLEYVLARWSAYLTDDHAARWEPSEHGSYGELGGPGAPVCVVFNNSYPRRHAIQAALHGLERWTRTGEAPANSPGFVLDSSGQLARDRFGNALGGLRNPVVDVPIAQYEGTQCAAAGYTVPFTDAEVTALYPRHDDYVNSFRVAADAAVARGFLLPRGHDDLVGRACAAAVRWPTDPAAPCPRPGFPVF
jgi:hypothetical protein